MPRRSESRHGLHQLPAGVIGAAGVADLAGVDQIVEGAQGFVLRREGVETVDLVEIDVIRPQAAETRVTGL